MSDLLSLLSSASYGLNAHRAAANTAAHNMQNAATPGYTRQRADLAAVQPAGRFGPAYVGRGVRLQSVEQVRDRFLDVQVPGALAGRARSAAESSRLQSVPLMDPTGETGLPAALSGFQASLRELSQNPGDPGLRQAAVGAARSLTVSFQGTARALAEARSGADAALRSDVDEVNRLSQEVARLNGAVRVAQGRGGTPNDLMDARNRAVDRLAELTGVQPVPDGSSLSLFLPGGSALVSGEVASQIELRPNGADRGHLAATLVSQDGLQSPLDRTRLGGAIGGLLDARDGALKSAEQELDLLAREVADAYNDVHRAGYGLDGTGGRDLFDAGFGTEGAASRIAVAAEVLADPDTLAAATDPNAPSGDASNVHALVGLESSTLPSGRSPAGTLSGLLGRYGGEASRAEASAEQDAAFAAHLTQMRDSVSGVSIDEELVELNRAQRAFEAVTRVINTADEMLDTLMRLGS